MNESILINVRFLLLQKRYIYIYDFFKHNLPLLSIKVKGI